MPRPPLATNHADAISAQAELHHAYLLGLQLAVSMRHGGAVVEEWMFRLFRRQHEEKFLASFDKLGLRGLPDAVACAHYHVLSNSIGGVPVEYLAESDRKAWVRFRYPRWMYAGPTLCGVPIGVSRGFLRGWYAHNGVSLGNPRLGYVCVSEDMSGEFGMCGYFMEYDHALAPDERLRFAPGELPPPFDGGAQPRPPAAEWSAERLARAARNYAVEYIRNGVTQLAGVVGDEDCREIAAHAARLIGLQYYPALAARIGAVDGGPAEAAWFVASMLAGMGDEPALAVDDGAGTASVTVPAVRVLRGLERDAASLLMACWSELWRGAARSHRRLLDLECEATGEGGWRFTVHERRR